MNKILITGDTGNTGSTILKLLSRQCPEQSLIGCSRGKGPSSRQSSHFRCDLSNLEQTVDLLKLHPIETIIHTSNIRHSGNVIEAAREVGVKHVILVHTTGVYSKVQSYRGLYEEIEGEVLRGDWSPVRFTILRPTMIYGNERDHNMHKLIKFLKRSPIFPIFGGGGALMQPIHVEDLAQACINCIGNEKAYNTDFDISGKEPLSYSQVVRVISKELGKKTLQVRVPVPLVLKLVKLQKKFLTKEIVTEEQVIRLQEDKCYDHSKASRCINFSPRSFQDGISQEVEILRSLRLV